MSEGLEVQQHHFSVSETSEMLKKSLELLEWVVARVPRSWHYRDPGEHIRGLRGDDRSVAVHLAHLVIYEADLANPVLSELAQGGNGSNAAKSGSMSWRVPKILELSKSPIDKLLEVLRNARARHIEIVNSFDDDRFNHPLTTLWSTGDGTKLESPGWVATKTVQHTGEHTNTIFRFALFARE
jgi:hypothetical protein